MTAAIPALMSGVVLTGHGGPEKLVWRDDLPVPKPAKGEVLVRVLASAVNNTDINTRIGWYSKGDDADDASWAGVPISFPLIQGIDACGHIVAVGDGVDGSKIGERVLLEPCLTEADGKPLANPWFLGSECNGAFADFVTIAARHAHAIDSSLDDGALASFPCSYSTAENMIERAGVAKGQTVLITGASGGVGSAAVQLVKARGARPIAVTSAEKSAGLLKIGAEATLPRAANPAEELGTNSVDFVIDLVGGEGFANLLTALKPGGRYAVAGAIGGALVELDLRTLYLKDLTLIGCTVLQDGVFANLIDHIEAGRIAPLVAARYPLRDINAAQEAFQTKAHTGKIVLTVETP